MVIRSSHTDYDKLESYYMVFICLDDQVVGFEKRRVYKWRGQKRGMLQWLFTRWAAFNKDVQYQSKVETSTHSRVVLYFYCFLHCRIIVKTSKL